MKRSQKNTNSFFPVLLSIALTLLIAGCGGGGGGAAAPTTTATTTTISGKVTLSSTVTGKPGMMKMKAMLGAPKGKPGSKAYAAGKNSSTALKSALLDKVLNATAFAGGTVYLYNADHPEWLYPVADSATGTDGSYSLTVLKNAANNNNAYTDGGSIPAGNYTLLAYKQGGFDIVLGITTKALVAVQTVVNKFAGTVSLSDLVAAEGTDLPTVTAMLGAKQNTDGTQTWGSAATQLPANAAVQVNFSTAMSRGSLINGITISPAVSGKWTLSADWTTATFYPDAGVTLAANTVYTITVKGSDTDATYAVKNVYGNALAKTATGTFTAVAADTVAPTAIFVSPTTAQLAQPVDVTIPIRIGANKQLDVNGLTLVGNIAGVSSLGAKPGILYVGFDTTTSLYVYEFVLGSPLKLATTYDLSVSGGKGLNGIAMNTLTGSLVTTSAANTAGIDPNATLATQDAQAAVKDVFGKWMRAFSDRNITQLKSLMSGDFYFEQDPTKNNSSEDINHDGRLSLAEFSNMLSTQAFPQWEFCGTTITGAVVGTINVVGKNADFEFKMTATSTNTTRQCGDAAPKDSLYATVQYVNGAWTVVRASEGIDTRTKTISFPNLVDGLTLKQGVNTIADGGTMALPYDPVTLVSNPATFSWNATTGVSSYVLLFVDARDPSIGAACALPTKVTSWTTGTTCGTDISGKLFNTSSTSSPGFQVVAGGQYYWEVIGLGTATTSNITSKTALEILNDISAISALQSVSVAGVYKEITVQVYGGTSTTGTAVTYSVITDGYDVGAASKATITVTTANTAATAGTLYVSGNFQKSYPLAFTSGVVTQTIDLSKGRNWISISDGLGLFKSFNITTIGGILPVVAITSITDDKGSTLTLDSWNYAKATTGATKVTITGTVDQLRAPSITTVDVNVWNDVLSAYSYISVPVNTGTFTATLDIYKGDNWISAGKGYTDTTTNSWVWYGDFAGIYTDTGTVWVPPISITAVTNKMPGTLATQTNSFGSSSDWTASPGTDGVVTVTGKFKNPVNGTYSISSDGGWNNGTLTVLSDGSFSLDVTLYNGWNYVSLNDANFNWYGVNIYTTGGKTVVKPTISLVNSVAPVVPPLGGAGSVSTTGCTATVSGTAKAGNLNVYWNGYDGTTATTNYYSESQTMVLTGAADTPIAFSFNVPLVNNGTGSYNNIDVYDASYMWTGVKVTTSSACTYTAPVLTLTSVKDSTGAVITYNTFNAYYPSGTSPTVTFSGTSSRAGRIITASLYSCTSKTYTATAVSVADGTDPVTGLPTYSWSTPSITVYNGYNYPSISDGYNWQYPTVFTTNGASAPVVLTATVSGLTPTVTSLTPTITGSCGYNQWDTGATTTSVTISGTTTAPGGTGNYTDETGASKTFTITGGAYSIPNVLVYNGLNYIYLYDTAWNYQTVAINSTNGIAKPKFVAITAPLNTSTTSKVTGVQAVTGTITDPIASGYKPTVVRATLGVYNSTTLLYTYTYYSSDAYDQTTYGDTPITYNATTGNYSFSANFGTGSYTYIDVYAYDTVMYASHGMTMYYNDGVSGSTGSTYYYKPGSKANVTARDQAVTSEITKQRLMSINRNR